MYADIECVEEFIRNQGTALTKLESFVNEKKSIFIDPNSKSFCDTPKPELRRYTELILDSTLTMVLDLENKKVLCPLAVLAPGHRDVLFVDRGAGIEIVEVGGRHIFPLVEIGETVYEDSKLCHVVTKKYEVRVIRSPVKGVVFYIGERFLDDTPKLIIVLVGEKDVVRLARGC